MAKWIEFSRDFPFKPKGKPHHLRDYKAGTTRQVVDEAAAAAIAGGYGKEVPAPATREEAAKLKESKDGGRPA